MAAGCEYGACEVTPRREEGWRQGGREGVREGGRGRGRDGGSRHFHFPAAPECRKGLVRQKEMAQRFRLWGISGLFEFLKRQPSPNETKRNRGTPFNTLAWIFEGLGLLWMCVRGVLRDSGCFKFPKKRGYRRYPHPQQPLVAFQEGHQVRGG